MKQLIGLLLIIIVSLSACEKESNTELSHDHIKLDLVNLDTFIVKNYYEDAKLLYVNEIFQDSSHFNRNNPVLDTSEITKVLKIIQTVYNLNSQESDNIFNEKKIHTRICINLDYLWLKVQKTAPEINNLIKGIIPTGNQNLDKLLAKYEYKSVKSFFDYIMIYLKREYNLIPIVPEFLKIPSIISNIWDSCGGDGNDITITRSEDSAKIIFSIGEGDCPAGCIYHKYWEFLVANNKAVFIRSY